MTDQNHTPTRSVKVIGHLGSITWHVWVGARRASRTTHPDGHLTYEVETDHDGAMKRVPERMFRLREQIDLAVAAARRIGGPRAHFARVPDGNPETA